ncbi:MAG: 50S ribosomal protein L15 [Armatimonadota bacterium]|jgi:large subunit ribosomal protein L15
MKLSDLKPAAGSKRKRRRVGRGISAGQGKTCGRGQKGQKARTNVRPGFEGGQTPLYRRLPKLRGQTNRAMNIGIHRKRYAVVNVGQLERFEANADVTPESLRAAGLVKGRSHGVRILGKGELSKPLAVVADGFSAGAEAKIRAAGGTTEVR